MMTQDRDYEDALRRALSAAAESIEPAGDGLQRIRHRLDSPRSPRSVLSGCADWLELHGTRFLVRLEPVTEAGRTALRRSGPLLALVSFLRRLLSPRWPGDAGGHRGAASSPGRLGPAGPWLKPVFAVSAAVAIVVVGVVILNHETGTLINPANRSPRLGQPRLRPGRRRDDGELQAVEAAAGCQPAARPGRAGRAQEREDRAARGGLHPDPVARRDARRPGRERDGDPEPDPRERDRDGHARVALPTETGQPTPTPTSSPATGGTATATTAAPWWCRTMPGRPGSSSAGASPKTPDQTGGGRITGRPALLARSSVC